MGPYSAARPQYLFQPEYPHPRASNKPFNDWNQNALFLVPRLMNFNDWHGTTRRRVVLVCF